jgi:hypothetical protein
MVGFFLYSGRRLLSSYNVLRRDARTDIEVEIFVLKIYFRFRNLDYNLFDFIIEEIKNIQIKFSIKNNKKINYLKTGQLYDCLLSIPM